MSYQYLDLADCIARRPQMPEQILPGLIRGIVGSIVAPGATGKSMLALELGIYRATGYDWLGFGPCRPGRVIVFAAEDPAPILGGRIHDLAAHLSPDEREMMKENLFVVPVTSAMPRDLLDGGRTADEIRKHAEGFDLAIIDTISRFHTGDENAREDAAKAMRQLERIGEAGPAVVFLGHTNKAAALAGQGDQQQASRGSSVWVDEARWVAFLTTCSPDEAKNYGIDEDFRRRFVRFGLSKANYTEPRPDIWLRRDIGGVLLPAELKMKKVAGAAGKKTAAVKGGSNEIDPWSL